MLNYELTSNISARESHFPVGAEVAAKKDISGNLDAVSKKRIIAFVPETPTRAIKVPANVCDGKTHLAFRAKSVA
jgi:hypothetical protein